MPRTYWYTRFRALPVSLAAFGLCFAGCSENLADNPLIADQQQSIQRLDERTQDLDKRIEDLNLALTTLNEQLMKAGNTPVAQAQRIAIMEREITNLKNAVQQTSQSLSEMKNRPARRGPSPAEVASAEPAPEAAPPAEELEAEPRVASVTAKVARRPADLESEEPLRLSAPAVQASSAASGPSDRATSGFYYLVQVGESLSSIAKSQQVSIEALRRANNLPDGREPIPGQHIFVPVAG